MMQARILYHLARADFLERVRRYSFLILLGGMVFLGYQVAIGNLTVRLDEYRGEFNSAWVGSMMALIGSFFLGPFIWGLIGRKATKLGAIGSAVLGLGTCLGLAFAGMPPPEAGTIGMIVSFGATPLLSLVF
jgi:hypothetical protein